MPRCHIEKNVFFFFEKSKNLFFPIRNLIRTVAFRSLSLWPKLREAAETRDEFASASSVQEEIRDFQVLRYGELGVHTESCIVYYDLKTLKRSARGAISGNYFNYVEDDVVILILAITSDLYVIRKFIRSSRQDERTSFPSVKYFILADSLLYYVTFDNDVYVCDLQKDKFVCNYLVRIDDVMCLGCKDGSLNVLTYERNVYTVSSISSNHNAPCNLDGVPNLMHYMHHFNFLERLDWRAFCQWMTMFKNPMPKDFELRDITIVKVYGDVVFVGTRYGVFRIYYAPYVNNEFDLFNCVPLKQYNFMERRDCPVLSHSPITQIDVIEAKDGHTVLVGMPKKIVLLQFSHDFKCDSK